MNQIHHMIPMFTLKKQKIHTPLSLQEVKTIFKEKLIEKSLPSLTSPPEIPFTGYIKDTNITIFLIQYKRIVPMPKIVCTFTNHNAGTTLNLHCLPNLNSTMQLVFWSGAILVLIGMSIVEYEPRILIPIPFLLLFIAFNYYFLCKEFQRAVQIITKSLPQKTEGN